MATTETDTSNKPSDTNADTDKPDETEPDAAQETTQTPPQVSDQLQVEQKDADTKAVDEEQAKTVSSDDVGPNEDEKEMKVDEQNDEKKEDKPWNKLDFESVDKLLFEEEVGKNSNDLSYDDIKFENDEEKQGAIDLAKYLESKHNLTNLPPFEMARFYIGSKCRIEKAAKKWMDTMALYKDYNLDEITDEQMQKCFKEMYKCIRFGGLDAEGRAVFAMKYCEWLPANYESTSIIMKCFFIILNVFTENLDVSRNGVVFVADCANLGWANFDVNLEKIFANLMQEAYPMRVGGFYMMDAPLLMNILMKICKPFLSKKMQERMHIMSAVDMFQSIPNEQVPQIITDGAYDDHTNNPFYETCIRYMRRCNLDHFRSVEEKK